jgi:hypothetical protein
MRPKSILESDALAEIALTDRTLKTWPARLAVASEWMFGPELAGGAIQRILTDRRPPPIDL